MQRIVLDTNIIVSSIISENGNPYKIVDMVFDDAFSIYYSLEILAEYEDVLHRERLNLNLDKVEYMLDAIRTVGVYVPHKKSDISLPDEDDRIFYDVAKSNDAILITGNTKHFPEEAFILTPAEFLDSHNE
ncbi:MAG: putative toxin-antitoxin system toxin component, PIN family [Clostridiales Family XIII bacterium]|jgi:putative PIN family toxin of toxin-antitoxin system|nr:putative toxin-antitoxin system toxin component, PIN family [Clostridiales Family XIII bacterium]